MKLRIADFGKDILSILVKDTAKLNIKGKAFKSSRFHLLNLYSLNNKMTVEKSNCTECLLPPLCILTFYSFSASEQKYFFFKYRR